MQNNSRLATPVNFDPHVPKDLQTTQEWFASIITRPLDCGSNMELISPTGQSMEKEVPQFIMPSPTMKPHERIEIYNQQYWWRLLACLHDTFPLTTRLFGYAVFNHTIGVPYLDKYPANHWSLSQLGARLLQWVDEEYHASDRIFVLDAVRADWTFDFLITVAPYTQIDPSILQAGDIFQLIEDELYLQSYVEVFHFPYNLLDFRRQCIEEEGDYWLDHDFPNLEKDRDYYFVMYRSLSNRILWKEISAGEYYILNNFKKGATIHSTCVELEKQGGNLYNEAVKNIAIWFQEWMARRWLCKSQFR